MLPNPTSDSASAAPAAPRLTHVNEAGQPAMVNVADKPATARLARAEAYVRVGAEVLALVRAGELPTRKGPVFQTAIIAGVMAAKKTADLIPLCHPLGLDDIQVRVEAQAPDTVRIECTARLTGRTGVEMEALTGATVAALTVYDMCKALAPDMVIEGIRLLEKTGGKSDYRV